MKIFELNFRKNAKRNKRSSSKLRLIFLPLESRQLLAGDVFSSGANVQFTIDPIVQTWVQVESKPVCEKTHSSSDDNECKHVDQALDDTVTLSDFTFDGDINTFNFYSTGELNNNPSTANHDRAVSGDILSRPGSPSVVPTEPIAKRVSELNNSSGQLWRKSNPDTSQPQVSARSNYGDTPAEAANPLESFTFTFSSGWEGNNSHDTLNLDIHHQMYFSRHQDPQQGELKIAHRTGVIDYYQAFSVMDIDSAVDLATITNDNVESSEFDPTMAMKLLAKIERINPSPIEFPVADDGSVNLPTLDQSELPFVQHAAAVTMKPVYVSMVSLESSPLPETSKDCPKATPLELRQSGSDIARVDSDETNLGDPIPLFETAAIAAFLVANFPYAEEEQDKKTKAYRTF